MIPEPFQDTTTQKEWDTFKEEIESHPEEITKEIYKVCDWIDEHRDDLLSISSKDQRRERVSTLIQEYYTNK